jgi:hypothetical protein
MPRPAAVTKATLPASLLAMVISRENAGHYTRSIDEFSGFEEFILAITQWDKGGEHVQEDEGLQWLLRE